MVLKRPSWTVLVPVLFGLVVASFGGATVLTEWRAAAIDRQALLIVDHTTPAIERLSEARRDLVHLRAFLREEMNSSALRGSVDPSQDEYRRALDAAIRGYRLAIVADSEEAPLVEQIVTARAGLLGAIDGFHVQLDASDLPAARAMLNASVTSEAIALDGALERSVELNARRSQDAATEIRRVRTSSARLAMLLDAVSVAVAFVAAAALWSAVRTHANLLTRLHRVSDERATELDAFAGRIAHDIRGPLGVIALSFDLAGRACEGTLGSTAIARGQRAVVRVTRLIDGLLEYARAGAQPETEHHADVHEVVTDVVDQLEDATKRTGAEIKVTVAPGLDVRCPPAALASIVANLAGNAIKYMHDAPRKSVIIRAWQEKEMIHLEVEDSGPGVPQGLESRIFDPFVRATQGPEEGIGLGLATVRRFAQSCGGTSGVRSNPDQGSTFWVVLPAATAHVAVR